MITGNEEKGAAEVVGRESERYWGDVLQSFGTGVQMDLRLRLALEFLKAGTFVNLGQAIAAIMPNPIPVQNALGGTDMIEVRWNADQYPKYLVRFALDLATEVVNEGWERGLMKDLPETGELNQATKKHIERNVRAQLYQQQIGQKIMQEETNRVGVVGAGALNGGLAPRQ
jgi:hypothetical protein